jgi:DNA-3-methyladenine glycosylase II
MSVKPKPLNRGTLALALDELAARDPVLRRILAEVGPPPLWARKPGFPALLRIILEQQVSLASAKAAYDKLLAVASPLTPERLIRLDDDTLKRAGFSRQKTGYARNLAREVLSGRLDLKGLAALDDAAARSKLIGVKGIGPWTADIYLLLALRRPDIWPAGDLALALATQIALRLASLPTPAEMEEACVRWKPWRAVAARILWHFYLSGGTRDKALRTRIFAEGHG